MYCHWEAEPTLPQILEHLESIIGSTPICSNLYFFEPLFSPHRDASVSGLLVWFTSCVGRTCAFLSVPGCGRTSLGSWTQAAGPSPQTSGVTLGSGHAASQDVFGTPYSFLVSRSLEPSDGATRRRKSSRIRRRCQKGEVGAPGEAGVVVMSEPVDKKLIDGEYPVGGATFLSRGVLPILTPGE